MILLEVQSKYNKAFDLADEAKENMYNAEEALHKLCECLEECYEACMEDADYEEDHNDENYANIERVEVGEINYRDDMNHNDMYSNERNMRGAMRRNMRNMRSNMRNMMMRKPMRKMARASRYSY